MQQAFNVEFVDNVRVLVGHKKFIDFRNITICTLTNLITGASADGYAIHNPTDCPGTTEGREVAFSRALRNTGLTRSVRRTARAAAYACPGYFLRHVT